MSFPQPLIERYYRFKSQHFPPIADRHRELAEKGQKPEVMIVSCCDSRCDPEAIFSAMPGELFVVRNVANLVPPCEAGGGNNSVSAALEFAVLNLKVKHIVVMGHSSCGGITASLKGGAPQETEARYIASWMSLLDDAKAKLIAAHPGTSDVSKLQREMEVAGIVASLGNLRTFPWIEQLEAEGQLDLHGAHFDIGAGVLSLLDQSANQLRAV